MCYRILCHDMLSYNVIGRLVLPTKKCADR